MPVTVAERDSSRETTFTVRDCSIARLTAAIYAASPTAACAGREGRNRASASTGAASTERSLFHCFIINKPPSSAPCADEPIVPSAKERKQMENGTCKRGTEEDWEEGILLCCIPIRGI
jgi:hypothetical protein